MYRTAAAAASSGASLAPETARGAVLGVETDDEESDSDELEELVESEDDEDAGLGGIAPVSPPRPSLAPSVTWGLSRKQARPALRRGPREGRGTTISPALLPFQKSLTLTRLWVRMGF
jgi:hypothetical protein